MKPLIVLLVAFFLSLVSVKLAQGKWDHIFAGNLAMLVMLLFTAMGHFKFKKGMAMMLPEHLPLKEFIIIFTGLIEIATAICLMVSSLRVYTGWFLIIFFLLLLPANINAAIKKVNYETGIYDGPGLSYLWFRIPFQIFLILWIYFFSVQQ